MKHKFLLPIVAMMVVVTSCGITHEGATVDCPAVAEASDTSALRPLILQRLKPGAIKPHGWILRQLQLQRDGLNGHLGEISQWLERDNNAWLVEGGDRGWEEVPYWLRGYSHLAYLLGDESMLAETQFWIDAVLSSQHPDGHFGPRNTHDGHPEVWSQMIMLWVLQNYYEYSGDERVLPFMRRYFEWEMSLSDDDFLEDYWENCRGGDNMWSVVWYYNVTGDASVVPLIEKIHRNNADCTNPARLPNWHNVNIAQYFREPAEMFLATGDTTLLDASYNVYDLIRRTFGQVPGGMFGGDENSRIGYIDPRQGTETCGFAEQILSDGVMLSITADPQWAENMEDIAFNSFPAAFTSNLKALRYLTAPNQTVSDSNNHNPGVDNSGPYLNMNPFSSRCCQHNHGLGWPSFAQSLSYATTDNGLAFAVYAPCEVTTEVGDGSTITITEDTQYPFSDKLRFTVTTGESAVECPLYFRVPSWTKGARATVNGRSAGVPCPGHYLKISGRWSDGDVVELTFPMSLSVRRWAVNQNSGSVDYGPLTLSLFIKERYVEVNSADKAIGDSRWQANADPTEWPTYEIYADSPWNYSLILPESNPFIHFKMIRSQWPSDDQPFRADSVPLRFTAKARAVPSWTIDDTGLTGVLPSPRARRSDKVEEITLIPMGAARLRISAFPTDER